MDTEKITYQTSTGRHVMACRSCGQPVRVRVFRPERDSKGQYRRVRSNSCRKCGIMSYYVVRPHVMTREEMAAFRAARRAEQLSTYDESTNPSNGWVSPDPKE